MAVTKISENEILECPQFSNVFKAMVFKGHAGYWILIRFGMF